MKEENGKMGNIFNSNITGVVAEKYDMEYECAMDMASGLGIRLTSPAAYSKKPDTFSKKNVAIWNGLQSEFFGSSLSSHNSSREKYSCRCKKYVGSMYKGHICENCGTEVSFIESDLRRTGWIILNDFTFINPIYAAKILDALGKYESNMVFLRILEIPKRTIDVQRTKKEEAELDKHPFVGKGALWFREHFKEVMLFYKKRKPARAKLFDELIAEENLVFTHCIPVYSSLLRTELPGSKGSKLYKMKINTAFQSIILCANKINEIPEDEYNLERTQKTINKYIYTIVKKELDIFKIVAGDITSKTGIIASKVLGGRYNFSARNIITSSSGILHSDEVALNYITFLELYRYEITNMYQKIHHCDIIEATNVWKKGSIKYNPALYDIMQYIVHEPKYRPYLRILISRNPCINYGSFQVVYIADVKPDWKDLTMTIPSSIITPFNADHDGDILNIFRLFGKETGDKFAETLNPRTNLIISRMNGRCNPEMLPIRNEVIGFFAFCTF